MEMRNFVFFNIQYTDAIKNLEARNIFHLVLENKFSSFRERESYLIMSFKLKTLKSIN